MHSATDLPPSNLRQVNNLCKVSHCSVLTELTYLLDLLPSSFSSSISIPACCISSAMEDSRSSILLPISSTTAHTITPQRSVKREKIHIMIQNYNLLLPIIEPDIWLNLCCYAQKKQNKNGHRKKITRATDMRIQITKGILPSAPTYSARKQSSPEHSQE
jgi:hypothetical protein